MRLFRCSNLVSMAIQKIQMKRHIFDRTRSVVQLFSCHHVYLFFCEFSVSLFVHLHIVIWTTSTSQFMSCDNKMHTNYQMVMLSTSTLWQSTHWARLHNHNTHTHKWWTLIDVSKINNHHAICVMHFSFRFYFSIFSPSFPLTRIQFSFLGCSCVWAHASINIYDFLLFMQCWFYKLHGILFRSFLVHLIHMHFLCTAGAVCFARCHIFPPDYDHHYLLGKMWVHTFCWKEVDEKDEERKERWMSLKSQINQYLRWVCLPIEWAKKKHCESEKKPAKQGTACMFRDCTSYRSCLCTNEHIARRAL